MLIFRQILLTSSIRNVWRLVRRIYIFISELKELNSGAKTLVTGNIRIAGGVI